MRSAAASSGVTWRAALLAVAGTGVATMAASSLATALALSPAYPARVGLIAGGVLLAALAGVRGHHPFTRLGPANVVTGARALIVALLAAAAFEPAAAVPSWWVVVTGTVAASLDLADGWLARRTGLASAFGARFDMEIDALLVLVLAALVRHTGRVAAWVLLAGLLRYLFVAVGVVSLWMARPLPPSRRRQAICVVQITALIIALAPIVPAPASVSLCAASLALLVWSFWVDVAWLAAARADGVASPTSRHPDSAG